LLGHQRLETTTIYTHVAKIQASTVVSPLDRISASQQLTQSSSVTETHRTTDHLQILISPHSTDPQANISLVILDCNRCKRAELEGISIQLDSRNWVQLDLPSAEDWLPQLQKLPKAQRIKIQSPEFYENIRREICRRSLAVIDRPPD
jgi:hypothetical protein